MKMPLRCWFSLLLLLVMTGAGTLRAQRERLSPEDRDLVEKRWPKAKKTYTSLRYLILQEGDAKGPSPEDGMVVKTLYKGSLLNGKVFDENLDRAKPFVVRLGRGNLIAGWEEALQRMHRGEKWLLVVPSELAYGALGRPPDIPRDATLVFELELVDFSVD